MIQYQAACNEFIAAVPLRLPGPKPITAIDFLWADNCCAEGDWADFTLTGDAASYHRFNDRAKFSDTSASETGVAR